MALASPEEEPLCDHLLRVLDDHPCPPGTPVAGRVGSVYFDGALGAVTIPRIHSTEAVIQIGGPRGFPGVFVDPSSRKPEVLASTENFASALEAGKTSETLLFGAIVVGAPGRLLASRDALGTRPLYFARGKTMALCSNPGYLEDLGGEVRAVSPGSVLNLGTGGETRLSPFNGPAITATEIDSAARLLLKALRSAVPAAPRSPAILFSGGLDSLVLAKLSQRVENPTLICSGLPGSKDIKSAKRAAKGLSFDLVVVEIDAARIADDVELLLKIILDSNPVNVAVALPIWLGAGGAVERGYDSILCGQGADELFGGYHRYLSDPDPADSMRRDLHGLHLRGLDAATLACRASGLNPFFPYLDGEVVDLALSLPVDLKISMGARKVVLRRAAEMMGLDDTIIPDRKIAIQYGSGVNKHVLRALGR